MSDDASDDDEVGYCRPPKRTQFKPGQSGNPRGRPKGSRNFATEVQEAHMIPVRVMQGKRAKTVTSRKAVLLRMREKALNGDARAMERFLEYGRMLEDQTVGPALPDSADDEEILAAHEAEILVRAAERPKSPRARPRRRK